MIRHQRHERDTRRARLPWSGWALWRVPASARVFVLMIEGLAFGLTATLVSHEPVTLNIVWRMGILALLTIGYGEAAARSVRLQRYLGTDKAFSNPKSVWSFAALLTLPLGWAAVFVVLQYAHGYWQRRRDATGTPYRVVFTAAAVVLAQLTVGAFVGIGGSTSGLYGHALQSLTALVGVPLFLAVNLFVVLAGMWLVVRPPSVRAMLPDADALWYEIGTLVLGVATAEFLVHSPVLTPAVLVLVALLHRSTVVKALQKFATTDDKTGLLTPAAWRDAATATLQRARRSGSDVAVLMVDLDHFKAVNDKHGHLAGDRVLAGVAACLRRELRGYDGVGRFGGEEMVAILDGVTPAAILSIADRLRVAIAAERVDGCSSVTASIGLAHTASLASDASVDVLLERADRALYAAKAAGRDRVRLAPALG